MPIVVVAAPRVKVVTPLMITAVCHLKPQVWTPRWKVQNSHLVKCSNKVSAPDIKAYSSALGVGVVESALYQG